MGSFHRYSKILVIIVILVICSSANQLYAGKRTGVNKSSGIDLGLFTFPVKMFRKYISGADGDRCPMYPTCSQYSLDAFKKHGPLLGWIMTCDRLMRCGRDEVMSAPIIKSGERIHFFDPVGNNDFWWKPKPKGFKYK